MSKKRGKMGFNPHRFVFNALEEPIDILKHDELYCINFKGNRIIFYEDMNKFTDELGEVFPTEKKNFKKFYDDFSDLYLKVIVDQPTFTTPDVVTKEQGLKQLQSHPKAYMKFLGYRLVFEKKKKHVIKPVMFKPFVTSFELEKKKPFIILGPNSKMTDEALEKYLDKLVEAEKVRKSKPFMIKPFTTEFDEEMNGIY